MRKAELQAMAVGAVVTCEPGTAVKAQLARNRLHREGLGYWVMERHKDGSRTFTRSQ